MSIVGSVVKRLTAMTLALLLAATLGAPVQADGGRVGTAGQQTSGAAKTILVGLERGADRAGIHQRAGFDVAGRIDALDVDIVSVPAGAVDQAIAAYRDIDGVDYAEANRIVRLTRMPNDDFVRDQYALRRIRAHAGWRRYGHRWRRTGGVPVAIVDSGIDRTHPEFVGKISHCRSWLTGLGVSAPTCQDTGFHGTHVAGIAAAVTNNRRGIAGVAFDARIMALQAFNSAGSGFTADIAAAIVYAARNGARVANYSFSATTRSATEHRAVRYAHRRGVTQVAATGNTGKRGVQFPARYRQVIGVSATNSRDRPASFTTFGAGTEVAAPGAAILSTLPGTVVYGRLSGSSMAAPHVAGLAALLRTKGYSPRETRRRIRAGATDLGRRGWDARYGHGRIDVYRSLRLRL